MSVRSLHDLAMHHAQLMIAARKQRNTTDAVMHARIAYRLESRAHELAVQGLRSEATAVTLHKSALSLGDEVVRLGLEHRRDQGDELFEGWG